MQPVARNNLWPVNKHRLRPDSEVHSVAKQPPRWLFSNTSAFLSPWHEEWNQVKIEMCCLGSSRFIPVPVSHPLTQLRKFGCQAWGCHIYSSIASVCPISVSWCCLKTMSTAIREDVCLQSQWAFSIWKRLSLSLSPAPMCVRNWGPKKGKQLNKA